MKVAVGGGRGFIGAAIVRALERAKLEVIVFGREGPPREPADVLVWAAGGREPDFAANRAAHVDAPLAAVRATQPQTIVYLSSAEIYGGAPVPFSETSPIDPRTPYAIAKHEGERALAGVAPSFFAIRPGVVYGPGQAPRMLVPRVIAALRTSTRLPLTPGDQTRDFLYVDDLAALVASCVTDDPSPGIYNAGTGRELSIKQACTLIANAIDPARISLLDFGAVEHRPDEQLRYVLDASRAATRAHWRAQVAFEDGVARTIASAPSRTP